MSTSEKRAREDRRDEKQREKERRRRDKRLAPRAQPELTTAAEIIGRVRSIEEVMQSLTGGPVERSAPPLPAKLFVGSLSDQTKSADLRAHFSPYGLISEAVVITDRDTGRSRNFGFVTMTDRKDAPAAIQALHGSELHDNRLVVNVATERR